MSRSVSGTRLSGQPRRSWKTFTGPLDWTVADLNHQVGYADILLSRLGIKYLIVEAKKPGALAWNRHAAEAALDQARRYAAEQRVHCIAISDGHMLYAADVEHGGLADRLFVPLEAEAAPEALWWLSVHGIYRALGLEAARLRLLPEAEGTLALIAPSAVEALLHPKYKLLAVTAPAYHQLADALEQLDRLAEIGGRTS